MHAPLDAVMSYVADAVRADGPVPDDAVATAGAALHVAGNGRLTPAQQVDIYRRQYWMRHVDSLLEDYPGLAHLVGEAGFEAFVRGYLAAHPPSHPSLRDLGHAIVSFGRDYEEFPAPLRGACVDMLAYEHAFVDLFDAADPDGLDAERLAAVPPDGWSRARVVLSPLLALIRLDHPVQLVRLALKRGESPAPPEPCATRLALYRRDGSIHFDELDELPFDLLTRMRAGEPLEVACDAIAATLDDGARASFAGDVGAWFASWTSRRFVVDVELGEPRERDAADDATRGALR